MAGQGGEGEQWDAGTDLIDVVEGDEETGLLWNAGFSGAVSNKSDLQYLDVCEFHDAFQVIENGDAGR